MKAEQPGQKDKRMMEMISLGYGSQLFQQSPQAIRRALERAGVNPRQVVNGIEHYSYRDVKRAIGQTPSEKVDAK